MPEEMTKNKNLGYEYRFIKGPGPRIFLLLHGTGGNENDLVSLAEFLDSRGSFLSPRGKVLENGMPRFFRRLSEGVFDLEDLKFRTTELADFVTQAAEEFTFDLQNVIAVGFSNGANFASALMLRRPDIFAAAILFRPMMIPISSESKLGLLHKQIFISSGKFDPVVPKESVKELIELFERAGAQVSMNWVDASHGLIDDDLKAAKEWLERGLK
jgi:phospholipase/carboxylesterase